MGIMRGSDGPLFGADKLLTAAGGGGAMSEDQIKHMVDRFLGWRVPADFNPDGGIGYKRPNYAHAPTENDRPTGTNILNAEQATEMVRYLLQGLPD